MKSSCTNVCKFENHLAIANYSYKNSSEIVHVIPFLLLVLFLLPYLM